MSDPKKVRSRDVIERQQPYSILPKAQNGSPRWRFHFADTAYDQAWSWNKLGKKIGRLFTFMKEMEQLSWLAIMNMRGGKRGYHHFQPIDSLCKEAQERLCVLDLDDLDELFRFRLGSGERLWGVKQQEDFFLLWWDPDHKVYLGEPR